MLGPSSLNVGAMAFDTRWKRLISPQDVRQFPKSFVSRSDALASASSFAAGVRFRRCSHRPFAPAALAAGCALSHSSSPQNTASDVAANSPTR